MYLVFVCHYFSCGLDGFSLFAIHDLGNLESYFVRSLKLSFAGVCVSWLDWVRGFRGEDCKGDLFSPMKSCLYAMHVTHHW